MLRCLAHLKHLTGHPVDSQFTSGDPERVLRFLHVRETGGIGLKILVAAGGDLYAILICLKSAVGMDAFYDALNVLGLTTPRIENELPPSGKLRWLSDSNHRMACRVDDLAVLEFCLIWTAR
jgi:hypothetical protein